MIVIEPEALRNVDLGVRVVDSYRTGWKNGAFFRQYEKTARPFSALFFSTGDVESVYRALDENGRPQKTVRCGSGDVLYLPRGARYRSSFRVPEGGDAWTFTVNFDLFGAGGEDVLLSPSLLLLPGRADRAMAEELAALHRLTVSPAEADRQRINSLYFSLLSRAVSRTPGFHRAIRQAVADLEREWNLNERMETYAARCGLSLSAFYRDFRAYTGYSPAAYRNAIRVRAAKSELINTDLSVRDVAEKCGFEDPFYFSRVFRALTGASPRDFRGRP